MFRGRMPSSVPFVLETRAIPGHAGVSLEALRGGAPVSRQAFYEALRDEAPLRAKLSEVLLGLGMSALAWETAPLSRSNAARAMVQLVLPHPALARTEADPSSFADHLASGAGTEGVRWFENFGRDARLVVPCEPRRGARFAHLASFLAHASHAQTDALWQLVGHLACEHLARTDAPVWVSTAGMAVPWLHVRLDLRPKYYRTESLRSPGA
jgi:hypothetical protein